MMEMKVHTKQVLCLHVVHLMWVLVIWRKVAAGLCFCGLFYLGHLQAVPVDLVFCC